MDRLNEARRFWGIVFSDYRTACDRANAAWYAVEDKQAFIAEEVQRLDALSKYAQKEIANWQQRSKP